ncbi:hypothetical protein DFH08DRAFT_1028337 [Mycena albidolilacea]|uniref:Uncharacterized protein n=1 Tax=Mycena albidolilacea TaxID=1033008 RepID=A0AAD6ZJZ9_9AGAR|nr:hypothetical protein DFH08DRAFT_1028337 [Mycena albidolilacea]
MTIFPAPPFAAVPDEAAATAVARVFGSPSFLRSRRVSGFTGGTGSGGGLGLPLDRLERLDEEEGAGGESERERESDVLVPLLRLVRSSAPPYLRQYLALLLVLVARARRLALSLRLALRILRLRLHALALLRIRLALLRTRIRVLRGDGRGRVGVRRRLAHSGEAGVRALEVADGEVLPVVVSGKKRTKEAEGGEKTGEEQGNDEYAGSSHRPRLRSKEGKEIGGVGLEEMQGTEGRQTGRKRRMQGEGMGERRCVCVQMKRREKWEEWKAWMGGMEGVQKVGRGMEYEGWRCEWRCDGGMKEARRREARLREEDGAGADPGVGLAPALGASDDRLERLEEEEECERPGGAVDLRWWERPLARGPLDDVHEPGLDDLDVAPREVVVDVGEQGVSKRQGKQGGRGERGGRERIEEGERRKEVKRKEGNATGGAAALTRGPGRWTARRTRLGRRCKRTHTFTHPPLASGTNQHAQGPGRWDKPSGNCEIYFAREHGGELSTTEKKRKGGVVPASHVADKERRGERIPSAASTSMYHVRRAAHRSRSSPARYQIQCTPGATRAERCTQTAHACQTIPARVTDNNR